jgi:hypothetical protein
MADINAPGMIGGLAQAALPGVIGLCISNLKFTFGAYEELSDGNPAAPCLGLRNANTFYTFLWGVLSGTRTIQINCKQASNFTVQRPQMVVRKNTAIGVNADVTGTAGNSTGWVTIGPLTVNPISVGVLTVDLLCVGNAPAPNDTFNSSIDSGLIAGWGGIISTPCLFDHIVTT